MGAELGFARRGRSAGGRAGGFHLRNTPSRRSATSPKGAFQSADWEREVKGHFAQVWIPKRSLERRDNGWGFQRKGRRGGVRLFRFDRRKP